MTQTFTLEGHTARLNDLMKNRWARASLRKRDSWLVAVAARQAGVTTAQGKRRVSLTVHMGPRQRCPDVDCFWKSLLDAMVACGALVDDGPKWCELAPVRYERAARAAMVVTLEDL